MPKSKPLSLSELNALLPRLQATVKLLSGSGGPSAAPKTGARAGRERLTRTGGAQLQEKLLTLLKTSKKGLALGDIVKKTGAGRTAVKYHLRALRSKKKARVVGNRQFARWMA